MTSHIHTPDRDRAQPRRLRRLLLLLGAVAVMTGMVAGCGDSNPDPQRPSPPAGDVHGTTLPDGAGPTPADSPDAVATEALSRIYSWQPVTDPDSGAGMRRARAWLSGELATVTDRGDTSGQMRSSSQWQQWRDGKAIVTATVKVTATTDDPAATVVARQALVGQTVTWGDATTTDLGVMTFTVDLAKDPTDHCWRLWRMQLTDTTPGGPS